MGINRAHIVSVTCEAHVGWLNGPHLRFILIPLRPHMDKYMGPDGSHPVGPHLKASQNPLELIWANTGEATMETVDKPTLDPY